ncbi:putative ribosome biogenesis protein C8F11.04 [Bidens hawaiensis]|uniref:putative ribosome biogenesis protein C8F11.04 n=1 Tax=Bidens hawaiensis TaxID=980011 RepID=UPI00404A47F0
MAAAIPPSTDAAVNSAVDALLKWKAKQTDSHNPQLLPSDDFIYLNFTLKKLPQKRTNPNKIPLPHPIISPDSSELCLIIDDRPSSNLTSKAAKQKIKADGIAVSKVIKLSKLRTDYKPFESKRKLCDSYDMFFADKRVIHLLPKLLGKQFFRKKKLPLGVDLGHKNWKEQIERACASGLLFFGSGTCSVVKVAKVSMTRDEIVENVVAAIEGGVGFVGKKLGGVRSLHLKFVDSVALPVYQALPDIKLKIEGVKENCKLEEGGEGQESKDGGVIEMSLDGDDVEVENIENVDEISGELDVDDDGGSDKKKRKGDEVEAGKKKRSRKGKVDGVSDDTRVKPAKKSVIDGVEVGKKKRSTKEKVVDDSDDSHVKPAKKNVKPYKRKAVEENDVKSKSSDKLAKKKGKKQIVDSGKKEKKKVRSVSRV